jgi:DNA repair exonuclease SbcCD ATPase subunit
MTAVEITEGISRLRLQMTGLEADLAASNEDLARALAVEPARYNDNDVREARHRKTRLEERLAEFSERIAALEAQLPAVDAVHAAQAEAQTLVKQLQTAHEQHDKTWLRYLESVERAESAARGLIEAARNARELTGQAARLAREFGLDVQIPALARPSDADVRFAHLVAAFVGEAAYGEPSNVLMRDLNAARAKRSTVKRAIASVAE